MSDLLTRKEALISPCGNYRYWLSRSWDDGVSKMPFIMLNPSTADADVDDPTIRRCMGFSRREGFGGIMVVNLYSYRATDPKELARVPFPVGGDTAHWIDEVLRRPTPVVCAWGANADSNRARDIIVSAKGFGSELVCLGKTKDGYPRHPLYVKADQPLEPFP